MSFVVTISKRYTFDAAHFLTNVPPDHKCARLHGHTYTVEVSLRGPVDNGFVIDFGDLDAVVKPFIYSHLDHRSLNDVLPPEIPTTVEHLAKFLFETFSPSLPNLVSIRVWETPTSWAEYRRGSEG
jgi:6-pyruvoyltetrahydropterin/6-carboxytetrahydropterin synthase